MGHFPPLPEYNVCIRLAKVLASYPNRSYKLGSNNSMLDWLYARSNYKLNIGLFLSNEKYFWSLPFNQN